ncbi:MAG: hypothetical protein LKF36_09720 [Lactobacillus sp.]|nr:hypothetical protein [Lactobacillus sp.]
MSLLVVIGLAYICYKFFTKWVWWLIPALIIVYVIKYWWLAIIIVFGSYFAYKYCKKAN